MVSGLAGMRLGASTNSLSLRASVPNCATAAAAIAAVQAKASQKLTADSRLLYLYVLRTFASGSVL